MTKDAALSLIGEYAEHLRHEGAHDPTITGIRGRFPAGGSKSKAMRWLGFMQGICYARHAFSLDQLKKHSRLGEIPS